MPKGNLFDELQQKEETEYMIREDNDSSVAQYHWGILLYPVRKSIEADLSLSRREQKQKFKKRRLELVAKYWGPPPIDASSIATPRSIPKAQS